MALAQKETVDHRQASSRGPGTIRNQIGGVPSDEQVR
jgi:hypothetical protein